MKRWRRVATVSAATISGGPPALSILSVTAAPADGQYIVRFSGAVAVVGSGSGAMVVDDGGGQGWDHSIDPTHAAFNSDGEVVPGNSWHFTPPDSGLSPSPASPQSGVTI